ncbi:MAG: type II toxin-antitoxin system VapC family toxin [Deltaproteobacteria bacterium]|nr:type II toxin-antitoxin system VapC family toxin [Deltaproteobacteria bacterium]
MVLVDTSVWVRHLRQGEPNLERLLNDGEVLCHPLVVGELACGNIRNRNEILSLTKILPLVTEAKNEEVLQFIEQYHLMGKGLGYIDVHLCASAVLTGVPMWTYDWRLHEATEGLGIRYEPV